MFGSPDPQSGLGLNGEQSHFGSSHGSGAPSQSSSWPSLASGWVRCSCGRAALHGSASVAVVGSVAGQVHKRLRHDGVALQDLHRAVGTNAGGQVRSGVQRRIGRAVRWRIHRCVCKPGLAVGRVSRHRASSTAATGLLQAASITRRVRNLRIGRLRHTAPGASTAVVTGRRCRRRSGCRMPRSSRCRACPSISWRWRCTGTSRTSTCCRRACTCSRPARSPRR